MKKILVLTDFSGKAMHAAEYALNIAAKVKADILLYNTIFDENSQGEELSNEQVSSKMQLQELTNSLRQKTERFRHPDYKPLVEVTGRSGEAGSLGEETREIVKEKEVWMVVMGAKGDESVSNLIFGSNTYSVIAKGGCPVLFVPATAPLQNIKKIALATDLEKDQGLAAVQFLKVFKDAFNSEVLITHTAQAEPPGAPLEKQSELVEISRYDYNTNLQYPETSFMDMHGYDLNGDLHDFARRRKVDIVAIIHHKDNEFQRIFHSSTTKLLVDHPQLPLLVFPEPGKF